jgi:hypothetical protein
MGGLLQLQDPAPGMDSYGGGGHGMTSWKGLDEDNRLNKNASTQASIDS